ncbi:PspC domain-containing protein [Nesterenkonia sp. YGD6]|uniref:PspC domain-containing protein n=1 Tax=Nesterenkonia sp. YGD6 TaxID=2901231 RepID=UPI001F4D0446|nr:PspC domain-containing protein [Nesterenkonia sp. YGD6]MCH8562813.1 PspC domain-containing protein [Nesterenkonia sp. YGD6]
MENHKPETGRRFFSWMRTTGLMRPDEGWFGGVFAGLAAKVGWDVALVRGLGVVAFIIFFSPAALLYGLAWILVPNRAGEIHAEQAVRGSFSSGFIGGVLLAIVGALNIFTPISIAGPLAVLINLVVLGAVAWLVYVLIRNHRSNTTINGAGGTRTTPGTAGAQAGKAEAGEPAPPRADGKPAWYPKEQDPAPQTGAPASAAGHGSAAQRAARQETMTARAAAPRPGRSPGASPRERAERRRHRQLSWGLAMLSIPVIIGLAWFGGGLGLSALAVALVATAGLVLLLASGHLVAALRGRPGAPGLLMVSTVIMLVLFAGQSGAGGFGSGANYAFGSYTTTESEVNSGFSNTTVDLRDLAAGDPSDGVIPTEDAEINNAFSNTTVIVPDDARIVVSNGQALSNLEIATQDDRLERSGISGEDLVLGPEDFEREIRLDLNSAFGNTTIYDDTTYAQEAENAR